MEVATKVCSICDMDLSGQKRVKDASGAYFCPPCWQARVAMAGPPVNVPATPVSRPSAVAPSMETQEKPVVETRANPSTPSVPVVGPEVSAGKKLGMFAVGLGAVVFFDLIPVLQARAGVQSLSVSFKGIFLGWVLAAFMTVAVLPDGIGFNWRRIKGQPLATREKVLFGITLAIGCAMAGLTIYYIQQQGYTFKF